MNNNNNNNNNQNEKEKEKEKEKVKVKVIKIEFANEEQKKQIKKNLIEDYSKLLKGNSFHNFSIFVENESNPEIKVHKSILSSRSPFFTRFLREQNDINEIFLRQFNKKEMESILSYIYYGNTSFENQEDLLQLLEISIYFKLDLLKEIIQEKISNSINYSNFFQLFFQNRNLKLNEIEIKCFEFLNQNFSQIQKDENLFSLTKEEIIRFIQFKQEKKEIFELDFFQFLSEWMKKSNKKLRGKKYRHKMNVKKRLSHSFFSLFDKDSISKKVFNKLKESDFILPKSFLLQKMKQKTKFYKNFPQFSDSEIEDIRYAKKLKKWINDNEFFSKMKKGYSAKKDGFNCQNWHKAVDNKGKTLVIIKTTDNYIFGGFTQIGFTTDKSKWSKILQKENFDYITDQNAFIFSLRNDKGNRKPEKFSIKKNDTKYAIYYDYFNHGPAFGGNAGSGDFILDSNLQSGCSKFGNSYKLPNKANFQSKDQSNSYLAGSYDKWVVDELETYFI